MELSIIYEDDSILAINKPAGIAVHKTRTDDPQTTLVDWLLEKYPEIASVGEDPLRPGIVHRLDKETSGVMIIAKTNASFFYLKNLFKTREIKKEYLVLVVGRPAKPAGTIDLPLGKLGTRQTTRIIEDKELVERAAVTDYATEEQFEDFTLLRVRPRTGRTHQIRVHLKSLGTPIAGDRLYGAGRTPLPAGLERLFLHARMLTFTTPAGQSLALEADLPEDLERVLDNLRRAKPLST